MVRQGQDLSLALFSERIAVLELVSWVAGCIAGILFCRVSVPRRDPHQPHIRIKALELGEPISAPLARNLPQKIVGTRSCPKGVDTQHGSRPMDGSSTLKAHDVGASRFLARVSQMAGVVSNHPVWFEAQHLLG